VSAVIQLAISRDVVLTSNQRKHWATKARHTKVIRDMAYVIALHERPQKMQAATCEAVIKWPKLSRTRDSHNLQPTVKAALDGVIGDYGLLPDDSDKYLQALTFTSAEDTHDIPGVACFVTLTFTEVPERGKP